MTFNAQSLLESAGINIEQEIPLPYGLSIKISMADGIEQLCETPNQIRALQGLMGVCQGIFLTLSELEIPLIYLVVVANNKLGIIISTRQNGDIEEVLNRLGLSCVQDLIDIAMNWVVEQISSMVPGLPVQYIEFPELEILWYKIVNSKMVYVLKSEYQSTHYSIMNGLDRLARFI